MKSLWEHTAALPDFPSLNRDMETDVLVIGGGMAGILCAYMLHQAGVDYVLTEAETICSGITRHTTAKLTAQHGLIYANLRRQFGQEKAGLYLRANLEALEQYRTLCSTIDCQFQEQPSFVYSLNHKEKLKDEVDALTRMNFPAEYTEQLPLPFATAGAVKFPNQAQFNPLQFVSSISKDLHIYEHTTIRELEGTTAIADHARINAKKIIVATHFPFLNKHGSYFLKLYQHRSYVIALENAPNLDGMYVDESKSGLSFRNAENLLLVGGGAHRTGKKGGGWPELRAFSYHYYPNAKEKYHWATQDCMTLDSVPYIGAYSNGTNGLYVATGFNKWGMTQSMVAAGLLCDLVQGRENPYQALFSPSRTMLRYQLAANAFEATKNLLTPTAKRCPHLGCALKWNSQEHSWDCPCHGSRFSDDGRLIDNPATGDLKAAKKKT